MTWLEIKTVIEAQGVTDETVIYRIVIEDGKPVIVAIGSQGPEEYEVKATY